MTPTMSISKAARPPSATSGQVVASLADVRVTFPHKRGDVLAVKGVTLDVRAGEIVALVGESGSGKTVLGLSLLGLLPSGSRSVVDGTIQIDGVVVNRAKPGELRRLRAAYLGAVFQDPMTSLNPTMTIGDQLLEVTRTREAAIAALTEVGMPEPDARFGTYPHQLSGGQRQRVMLAMAIARQPRLIVLDEPTTALDVTVQAQVLQLLNHLRGRTEAAMLFITHDLGVAAQIADRILVMYSGRAVELGATADVLETPEHPYARALLRSRLSLDTDRSRPIPQLRGEMPAASEVQTGCAYGPRCSFHQPECDVAVPELRVRGGLHVAACVRLPLVEPARDEGADLITAAVRSGTAAPALDVSGLRVQYRRRSGLGRRSAPIDALRGIDLRVERGECVSLVGESGSGKSTLLQVVAGLQKRTAGDINVHGDRPQMVFQDAGASLTPWLTAEDLVGERLRGVDRAARRERVGAALRMVGLPDTLRRAKPGQLSGGQRQRLALARAIVDPPRLLLADEPTSALDVSLAAVVLNLIGELRRRLDMAVLFVTHDIAAARVVADRIAVMYLGQIVEEGPAERVITAPRHEYTRSLLAAVPSLDRPLRAGGDADETEREGSTG